MIKPILVFLFWLLTLGLFSIYVQWDDGWSIELIGWPDALARYLRDKP